MSHLYISNTFINGFITGLQRLGIDLDSPGYELSGFSIDRVRKGQRIDINLLRQIWHRAEAISQDPLLGYKIGLNLNIKGLGPLGPVLMHSPTIRSSLHNLANAYVLISESIRLQVVDESDGTIVFHFNPRSSPIRENSHHIVSLVTSMLSMGRYMGIDRRVVLKLRLPANLDLELLSKKFRTPIESAQTPPYCIWFSAKNADDELPGSDLRLYQLTKSYTDELLLKCNAGNQLVDVVKSLIVEKGYLKATIDDIADSLEINKRNLQRQLTEEKTTFRDLKEEIIKDRSLSQIIKGDKSFDAISEELGYSEFSAFHRAFRGWFGVTPKDYSSTPALQ